MMTALEIENNQPLLQAGLVTRGKWWHKWDSGASEFGSGKVRNFVAEVVFDDLKNIL
jgi:hypothetical protein